MQKGPCPPLDSNPDPSHWGDSANHWCTVPLLLWTICNWLFVGKGNYRPCYDPILMKVMQVIAHNCMSVYSEKCCHLTPLASAAFFFNNIILWQLLQAPEVHRAEFKSAIFKLHYFLNAEASNMKFTLIYINHLCKFQILNYCLRYSMPLVKRCIRTHLWQMQSVQWIVKCFDVFL